MEKRILVLLIVGCTLTMLALGDVAGQKESEWSHSAEGPVASVAISANGEYVAAASEDSNLYLYSKDDSTPLWNYSSGTGWGDRMVSASISADGEYIAAGSMIVGSPSPNSKVHLFHKDSSTPLWNHTTTGDVTSVAISADGEYIVVGTEEGWQGGWVYLFSKANSTPLWSHETEGPVTSVAISADGENMVAGSEDKGVYLFNKDNSTPRWSHTTGDKVRAVSISADGSHVAAGSLDDGLYLFNKDSSTPLWSYDVGADVFSVAISADGEYIAAGSGDRNVYLFDKQGSTPLWNHTTGDGVGSVSISANGHSIVAGPWDGKVYLFDKVASTPLWSYVTHNEAGSTVYSAAISADGEYVAAGTYGEVYLLDRNIPPTAQIDSILPSPATGVEEITFSGSGLDADGFVNAHQWNSSVDGFLSDEEDFSKEGLSVGVHIITLRVQDDDGEWSDETSAELTVDIAHEDDSAGGDAGGDEPGGENVGGGLPALSMVASAATLTFAAVIAAIRKRP